MTVQSLLFWLLVLIQALLIVAMSGYVALGVLIKLQLSRHAVTLYNRLQLYSESFMRTVLVIGVLEICGTAYWASETMVLLDQPFSPRAKLLLMFGYWQVIMGFLSAGIDGELEGIRPDSVRRVRTCDDWSEAFWWAVIYLLVPVTACFLM